MILKGYMNTLYIVVVGVVLNMVMTVLGAYFLSRKHVKWQKPIMLMILFTMFFSGGLVPFYLTVRSVGLENSHWALILPSLVNTFNLIITRTGFEAIPESLIESVEVDGGNHLVILTAICIPLIMPTIAVIVLYYAVDKWNAWFHASIFLNDRIKYPLQLVLREILISNDTSMLTANVDVSDTESVSDTLKYAIIIVATLPVLCLYPFLQKYFVNGVMLGAVKG
jgi:putative aldouronate transport system permease protein